MNEPQIPPWDPTEDEIVTTDPTSFSGCDEVLRAIFSEQNDNIIQISHHFSNRWGKILRAKILKAHRPAPVTMIATCWSKTDPDVDIALKALSSWPE